MWGHGFQDAPRAFASAVNAAALDAGARNLVKACAEVTAGHRVLILHEDPALGWHDRQAPLAVARVARQTGAEVTMIEVGGPDDPLPRAVGGALDIADVAIWFARVGDRDRFAPRDPSVLTIVSYARSARALASAFGTRPHCEMVALKRRIDARMASAREIRVTCPLGTDLIGTGAAVGDGDVTIRRFPMCVPCPVLCAGFSGQVALKGFLTPTGSRSYHPASVALPGLVLARIESGRLIGLEGDKETIVRMTEHYSRVAAAFGIEPDAVHSFHAGIHEGCMFDGSPEVDPDLWSNSVFGSPAWLHFHTCGNYAPGEISWMVENPTIRADGDDIWHAGKIVI